MFPVPSKWRFRFLMSILIGLLVWIRITDRSSPAYPSGQFEPIVVEAAVIVALVWGGVRLWRIIQGGSNRKHTK
jgi:hypothetical protein